MGGGWGLGMASGTQKFYGDVGRPNLGLDALHIPQKVAKSMTNITIHSCGHFQPVRLLFWPATAL